MKRPVWFHKMRWIYWVPVSHNNYCPYSWFPNRYSTILTDTFEMIWNDDMIHDMWYDIFVNCNWVDTRCSTFSYRRRTGTTDTARWHLLVPYTFFLPFTHSELSSPEGGECQYCSLLDKKSCSFVDESQRFEGSASSKKSYILVIEAALHS